MFTLKEEARGSTVVLFAEGQLDAVVEKQAKAAFEPIGARAVGMKVVLDIGGLQLVDSIGIAALVNFVKHLRARGGELRLARLSGQPAQVFRLLRLDRSIDVSPTVDEAITRF